MNTKSITPKLNSRERVKKSKINSESEESPETKK